MSIGVKGEDDLRGQISIIGVPSKVGLEAQNPTVKCRERQ